VRSVHEGVWGSNVTSAMWISYEEVAFRRMWDLYMGFETIEEKNSK
jgi:hypothetical protein